LICSEGQKEEIVKWSGALDKPITTFSREGGHGDKKPKSKTKENIDRRIQDADLSRFLTHFV
jgi:hypothetical protein